jgi:hypothetical protein
MAALEWALQTHESSRLLNTVFQLPEVQVAVVVLPGSTALISDVFKQRVALMQ